MVSVLSPCKRNVWRFRYSKRIPVKRETEYLDKLVRGVYANKDLKKGEKLTDDDYFMAIPLRKGQLSCRVSCR